MPGKSVKLMKRVTGVVAGLEEGAEGSRKDITKHKVGTIKKHDDPPSDRVWVEFDYKGDGGNKTVLCHVLFDDLEIVGSKASGSSGGGTKPGGAWDS